MRSPLHHLLRTASRHEREGVTTSADSKESEMTLEFALPHDSGSAEGEPMGGGTMEVTSDGDLASHRTVTTPKRRRGRKALRGAQLAGAALAVGCASIGVAVLPAAAATTPGITASPDVVVGEAAGSVTIPVTLSAPSTSAVTVNYSTYNGTGGSNTFCEYNTSSYVGSSGTLTFAPGVTTQNVVVNLLDCHQSISSGFFTFFLGLSGNSVGSTINRATTQVDVVGDTAAATTPGLSVLDRTVDATANTVQVPVVLGGASGAAEGVAVTVPYSTHDGSATAGTDYTTTSGTLTFPAGQTEENVTVPILDRSGAAAARSFSVTLGTPTNAILADATGVVTIGASGASPVSLATIVAPPDTVVGEAAGYLELPVTLNAPALGTVTVNYSTANGTGGSNTFCEYNTSSYEGSSGTLTFLPGVTTQVVRIPILNCNQSIGSGFFTYFLTLSGNSVGSTINRATTQVDVVGDTAAATTPGLSVLDRTVDATANTVQVPVVLGGASGAAEGVAVTVPYSTHDGSATAGTDYTTTSGTLTFPAGQTEENVTVPILDRSGAAAARSFSVTLGTPTNAILADATGVVTIGASGASPVSLATIVAPPDTVVGEAAGYLELPVTLNAPALGTVTVNYSTANGTGGSNTFCEYNTSSYEGSSGTLTFLPGVTTQVVRIPILNCNQSIGSGFFTYFLTLSGNSVGSTINRATTQVDVVGDTAAATTPGLSVLDRTVDATANTVQVPVVLGGASGAAEGVAVTVPYSTHDGSATAGTDYTTTSGTLTFPAGQTEENVTVPILDRSGAAAARSFSVTLGTPTNAILADATGVVTIGASGASPVSLATIVAPPDTVVGEAAGYLELPVTLNAPALGTVTVNYSTANGTGGSNTFCEYNTSSYEGSSGTLTFLPGVTTQVVRIPILNCNVTGPLTFTLNLSGNSVGSTINRATTTVTIVSAITAPGAPTAVSAVAGNGSAVVSFTAPASDGGDPINSYTVTSSPGGITATGAGSPITVSGLSNGTSYTFTVKATSPAGTGAASAASASVTPAGAGFAVTTTSLPAAVRGHAYGPATLAVSGVTASSPGFTTTVAWAKGAATSSGPALPKGLKLSKTGVLSGTPSATVAAGSYTVSVKATETVTTVTGGKAKKVKTTTTGLISLSIS